ncbi:hypothetical protein Tco_0678261 [Tanacetum coccineum]|uniref:Reverse transcriptase domain-containing protein n=1 Tax=Tanacetum coccineum TaxID=301880 RepID=A0ABQ4XF44_9ASTR
MILMSFDARLLAYVESPIYILTLEPRYTFDILIRIVREPLELLKTRMSRGSFDVFVGMDRLSKRKFGIVCYEKVVRIPLEGDEILRVHGEQEEHGVHLKLELELLRKEKLYAKSSVKDKILATSSEMSKVGNTPAEMLRDLDQQIQKRADDGKANVVTDALSRKERVIPRRVRAMAMIIQYGVRVNDY